MKRRDLLTLVSYTVSLGLFRIVSFMSPFKQSPEGKSVLAVEAGVAGWREPAPGLLDIEQSAREYLDENSVLRLEITDGDLSYLKQARKFIRENRPTHYFYDTRTGSAGKIRGLTQAFSLALYLTWRGVIPITLLTNFPARKWRRQVSVVTAARGLVLILLDPKDVEGSIPHRRIFGPVLMPFSKQRLERLRQDFPKTRDQKTNATVTFVGTVYEPRLSKLNEISKSLDDTPLVLEIIARDIKSEKIAEERYWKALRRAAFVLTTSDHTIEAGADNDIPPHMVYRYTEALVAEGCLIAPRVNGPLIPWIHFVPFESPGQLSSSLQELLQDPARIDEISEAGGQLIKDRVNSKAWWTEVDDALGPDKLKK